MNDAAEALREARDAFARHDWVSAKEGFAAAGDVEELPADDLTSFGMAAWWLGEVDLSSRLHQEAYRRYVGEDARKAAGAALEVAVGAFLRGDEGLGSGWMARAQRILADLPEGVEHGYIIYLTEVEGGLEGPDLEAVIAAARRVRGIGREYDAAELVAIGLLGEGRARIKLGDIDGGMALLDESMVAVLSGRMSPDWVGNAYCHLMAACHEVADLKRMAEWTEATGEWLDTLSPAVLFTGVCRVHRSQLLHVRGQWERAELEVKRVCEDLDDVHVASVAEARFQLGEILRLRGDLNGAESEFRKAHALGRDPQPGLALVRLAQGKSDAAAASLRSALAACPSDRPARFRLRAAQVEVALAAGDLGLAREACEELTDTSATFRTPGFEAISLAARGAVLLAEGDPAGALPPLRDAVRRWRALEAPYEAARVCLLLARAYADLGDEDAASLEREAAGSILETLGVPAPTRADPPGGLTEREAEVLVLVAQGKTNRQVAGDLSLSEKTVARHLSNIFAKLGLQSRTAAAAYAIEHGLPDRYAARP